MAVIKEDIWNQVLEKLALQLSPPTFETWIKPTKVQTLSNDQLVLLTDNPFARNWLQKHYLTQISTAAAEVLGHTINVTVTVKDRDDTEKPLSPSEAANDSLPAASADTRGKASSKTNQSSSALNPKAIFSRFVVGANNRMAHAAALAVAESPGREFNPLFLCGGVGLGKTHLMQAIGHYRIESNQQAKVAYVSTETFTNDLIASIRRDTMQRFREQYREVDVILVDDIQFIEGKEYTQEEFFHTFNTLHEAGKQIVLASDRPPNQIPRLQDRLCSRFSMGLIADIQSPDFETRMAILQKKAEYEQVSIARDVTEYIASSYVTNIRELEGALTRAIAYTSISGLPMTVENLVPVLNPPVERVDSSPKSVIKAVSDAFKISLDDLKSNSRKREISQARQVGMYLMRKHTDLSLPKIGDQFGGKDHTTVMYSCDKIAQLIKQDLNLAQTVREVSDRITLASNS
ncbi:chromosomal replication initiator protein DnaA [Synechococcus sp. PCC 7335]|uniref:chromosomal replication initiator protein DnaA n=1 Tax=Synechococcus sp. (strain ATCC 29403 / PCC 7335) TaxID=91464 RepID=UPI00017EB84B|nr:chromosomal replication initiator protein DnaA [Synechococcus sp. PCC 7335]EDX86796.1 chromosomal replication initiator protein DnaA [Synechococcus sp. PCC 7335]